MSEDTTTTVQSAEPTATAPTAPAPGLTIGDLVLTAQVIQRASTAGVFRAEELKPVGDFYDRLIKFLESSGAIQRTQEQQPATPTA